jgi:tRNA(adenine34) deaminase
MTPWNARALRVHSVASSRETVPRGSRRQVKCTGRPAAGETPTRSLLRAVEKQGARSATGAYRRAKRSPRATDGRPMCDLARLAQGKAGGGRRSEHAAKPELRRGRAGTARARRRTIGSGLTFPRAPPGEVRDTRQGSAAPGCRWVRGVTTVSTYRSPRHPSNRDAATIARSLASPRCEPEGGVASGLRMLLFYINRGGRGLSAARRAELQRPSGLMQDARPPEGPRRRRALGKNTTRRR